VIGPWLRDSIATLHLNSSIAVDGFLMNKPAYSLEWISTKAIRDMCALSFDVSKKLKNEDDLTLLLSGKEPHAFTSTESEAAQKMIQDWIYSPNEGATSLVVEVIEKVLLNSNSSPNKKLCKEMALFGSLSHKSARGWIEGFGRRAIGPGAFEFLRTWVLTKNIGRGTKITKKFKTAQVQKIITKLNLIDQKSVTVRSVKNKDLIKSRTASSSVVVY
jgi:hypothetical protein